MKLCLTAAMMGTCFLMAFDGNAAGVRPEFNKCIGNSKIKTLGLDTQCDLVCRNAGLNHGSFTEGNSTKCKDPSKAPNACYCIMVD